MRILFVVVVYYLFLFLIFTSYSGKITCSVQVRRETVIYLVSRRTGGDTRGPSTAETTAAAAAEAVVRKESEWRPAALYGRAFGPETELKKKTPLNHIETPTATVVNVPYGPVDTLQSVLDRSFDAPAGRARGICPPPRPPPNTHIVCQIRIRMSVLLFMNTYDYYYLLERHYIAILLHIADVIESNDNIFCFTLLVHCSVKWGLKICV